MNSWKKKKKKEKIDWFELFIPLFIFSTDPYVFCFLGSPLCLPFRRLHFSSLLSCGASVISVPASDVRTDNGSPSSGPQVDQIPTSTWVFTCWTHSFYIHLTPSTPSTLTRCAFKILSFTSDESRGWRHEIILIHSLTSDLRPSHPCRTPRLDQDCLSMTDCINIRSNRPPRPPHAANMKPNYLSHCCFEGEGRGGGVPTDSILRISLLQNKFKTDNHSFVASHLSTSLTSKSK